MNLPINVPGHASLASVREKVSPAEWQLRCDLAAAYRLVKLFGWDDLVFTHISARIPGTSSHAPSAAQTETLDSHGLLPPPAPPLRETVSAADHHFLINPYGFMFEEITASSLVKIDLSGKPVGETPYYINPAGFTIHSAIHAAREDAACVLHVHCLNGIAVSAQAGGVLPISQQSLFVLSSLGYHDYEGVALNADEKPRLVNDLGGNNFLMLRNHGLLTVGPTIADAFLFMYLFETTCMIQVRAQSGGAALTPIPQPILDNIQAQSAAVTKGLGGQLTWPGLLRRLSRVNPGWDQ